MRGLPRQVVERVGRRGSALLFFATLDLIYAYRLLQPSQETVGTSHFRYLATVLPLWVWGLIWVFVGLVCLFHAFHRADRWGFAAAIAIKVGWGCISLGGWLTGQFPDGYSSAAIWLSASGLVGIIAGWPEPGDRRGPTWKRHSLLR